MTQNLHMSTGTILEPSAYSSNIARKLGSDRAKIWLFGPSQRMFFYPTKTLLLSSSRSLVFFGIRTEETEHLKNFQVLQALVVAAEKTPLNVHRFET